MPAATPRAHGPETECSISSPAIPIASDALSPAAAHNFRSSSTGAGYMLMDSPGVPHNMVRGAMRMVAWLWSPAGKASAIRIGAPPTQIRRGDVAVGRPRCGAHLPAVGGVQITGSL